MRVSWNYFTSKSEVFEPDFRDFNIKMVPTWGRDVFLEWEDLGKSYNVYSCDTESGPYQKLTAVPITQNFYRAPSRQDRKAYEELFMVEVVGEFKSKPIAPGVVLPKFHFLRQKDIIRREAILLDKFVGVDSIIFTPKIRGNRCPHCWDPRLNKVVKDHCEHCYGTSFEGGYHIGAKTKLSYAPIDPVMQASYIGNQEDIMTSAWGLNYPLIQPHAMVLRLPDRRVFRVEGHRGSTEMLTTMQRQTVALKELSKDRVEYKLFEAQYQDVFKREPHKHE